jgi:hypothetical protein
MILLLVKVNEAMKRQMSGFERAWYRLVNEDTSQTLDYKLFKDVNSPDAIDAAASGEAEGEEGGEVKAAGGLTHTYIAGRIFFDHRGSGRWVYEAFNHIISSERVG